MTIHENRTAAADYTCSICGGRISKGTNHVRTRGRSNGARTSVRSHLVCPRVQSAYVHLPTPRAGSPDADALMKLAASMYHAGPIPTRPVPKPYSSAGEKKLDWRSSALAAVAILLAVFFLAAAVSGLVASYGGGQ